MGYALAFGPCAQCKQVFGFNPVRVPSVRINGEKEPVCKPCIDRANPIRKERGLPEFTVHPDAYEPINEEEL